MISSNSALLRGTLCRLLVCAAIWSPPAVAQVAGPDNPSVLVFSKTTAFRHGSIPEAISAIQQLGDLHGFRVETTEDGRQFTNENLGRFDAVAFVLTSGNVLNDSQQSAFEGYIRDGGGFVGVHSASDTEYDWPWYGELIGAYFDRHPAQQNAVLTVEDSSHPSTQGLPLSWSRFDEWYDFQPNPRNSVSVLLTVDESTYSGGGMGEDHPVVWYHAYDGGRSWYTALGHTDESYGDPNYLQHLSGGIQYAIGGEGPLIVDESGQWFQRRNSGRSVFMAGAGGPEGFLYETDARKQAIVDKLAASGGNALYMHSIRSFEGDGYDFEDPFNSNNDPASGIAPGVFENWLGYLSQLDQAGIITWFHVLDDTARPWGCNVPLSPEAVTYIEALVNAFKGLDNLVWLAGEEYLMGSCTSSQDKALMSAIAAEIRRHDDVHPVGVHHNNGQSMQFADDPDVDVFAQQICGSAGTRNPDGIYAAAERGDWVYVMAECHPWHLNLLHDGDRMMLRLSNWATAMAGGYVLMYNAFECSHAGRLCSRASDGSPASASDPHDPTVEMLADLRRLRQFMEASGFAGMQPVDVAASGDTRWVLSDLSGQSHVLYASGNPQSLGLNALTAGDYELSWFDPTSGNRVQETRNAAEQPFTVPAGMSSEVALFLSLGSLSIIFADSFGG